MRTKFFIITMLCLAVGMMLTVGCEDSDSDSSSSGGSIVGSWRYTESEEGLSFTFTVTFNEDGSYSVTGDFSEVGTYTTSGSRLTISPSGTVPEGATYSVSGNTLSINFDDDGDPDPQDFTRVI